MRIGEVFEAIIIGKLSISLLTATSDPITLLISITPYKSNKPRCLHLQVLPISITLLAKQNSTVTQFTPVHSLVAPTI